MKGLKAVFGSRIVAVRHAGPAWGILGGAGRYVGNLGNLQVSCDITLSSNFTL